MHEKSFLGTRIVFGDASHGFVSQEIVQIVFGIVVDDSILLEIIAIEVLAVIGENSREVVVGRSAE